MAKRRRAPQTGRRKVRASRSRAKARSRRFSKIERTLRDVDKAVDTLGREKLHRGPISLGKTRSRVAGRRGVKATAELFAKVQRPGSLKGRVGKKRIATLTYTITIRAPDGTTIRSVENVTIPRMAKHKTKKKLVKDLERELWQQIFNAWEEAGVYEPVATGRVRKKIGAAEVRRRLGGNATFQVEISAQS